MVILAVDYGDARTGIAVCDRLEMLAAPVCVLAEKDREALVAAVLRLAREHKAELLLIGLPKNMDGSLGPRAQLCLEFADLLREQGSLPVELRDERLSTAAAHRVLNAADKRGAKRKKIIDAVAATMILQDFLDYRKNQKV